MSVQNVIAGQENSPIDNPFSIGIHPMHIDIQNVDNQFFILKKESLKAHCWAIGECGLDRRSSVFMQEQEMIFKKQIQWAMGLKKPVVVHCVKAFSELVKVKKECAPNIPMIVHGFNNNEKIFMELVKNDFFFSFGSAILQPNSNATNALKNVPTDRFFLETDDKKIGIKAIYEAASSILNIEENVLKALIINNLKQIKPNFNE